MDAIVGLMGELAVSVAGPHGCDATITQGTDGGGCRRSRDSLTVVGLIGELLSAANSGTAAAESSTLVWAWIVSQCRFHKETHGDGGWLFAFILSDVVRKVHEMAPPFGVGSVGTVPLAAAALDTVHAWMEVFMGAESEGLNGVVKVMGEEDLIRTAFTMLHAYSADERMRWDIAKRVVEVCGMISSESKLYPDRVIVDVAVSKSESNDVSPRSASARRGLRVPRPAVGMPRTAHFTAPIPYRMLLMSFTMGDSAEEIAVLAGAVLRCKATLVASQRVLAPRIQQVLGAMGVACIERLSIRYIHLVRIESGASLLVSPEQLASVDVHACGLCYAEPVERHSVFIARDSQLHQHEHEQVSSEAASSLPRCWDGCGVVTLCVPPPPSLWAQMGDCDEGGVSDVRLAVETCVKCMCRLFGSGEVVAGGGQFELLCAEYLQERAARLVVRHVGVSPPCSSLRHTTLQAALTAQVASVVAETLARFAFVVLRMNRWAPSAYSGAPMAIAVNDIIGVPQGTHGEHLARPRRVESTKISLTRATCHRSPTLEVGGGGDGALLLDIFTVKKAAILGGIAAAATLLRIRQ